MVEPNGNKAPLASIITLTYNRRDSLLRLLLALQEQNLTDREIIVVDNASEDGTAEAILQAHPDVRLIRCPANLGAVAYGFGIANARGRYLLMIDDDGLPDAPDWASRIVSRLEANPKLAVAACLVRMADTGQVAPDSPQFLPQGLAADGYPAASHNGTGAGLRAEAVRAAGGYAPLDYFIFWEELHLCTRLLDAGWEVRCFPDIEVWHCRSSGSVARPLTYRGIRNYLWYVWSLYPWRDGVTETLHFIGSGIRAVLSRQMPAKVWLGGLCAAVYRWPGLRSQRHSVSRATIRQLRLLRRQGHVHSAVPALRDFPYTGCPARDPALGDATP